MPPRPLPSPLLHPAAARRPGAGWRDIATWLLFALAALRGVLLLAHDPLLALANNYDQVRYTACLGLYPYRPGVPPQQQNYQAPLRTYAFQAQADAVCYWTSDLLFQGAAAAGYRLAEGLGGGPLHSVRSLAALRLAAWLLAALLLQRAWRRDGRSDLALAHAACVAVLAMDPVNTLLLGGWYAEAGALFFAWFAVGLAVLAAQRATPLRLLLLALAAFGLGTSKLQHLLLPLCLGGALLLPALWRTPRLWAPLLALLLKPLFAARMLADEVAAVEAALQQDLAAGRARLAWLVSRDVSRLDAAGVRESAIETLAENLNDSVVAPLVAFALAGLPGAVLYRAANTLDAMWGYRGDWEWAGKWAARADDVLSWPTARLTAALLRPAWRPAAWARLRREARVTPSPNGGWPMGAMALRLGVRLRKPGVYALHPTARPPLALDVRRAIALAQAAGQRGVQLLVAGLLGLALLTLLQP